MLLANNRPVTAQDLVGNLPAGFSAGVRDVHGNTGVEVRDASGKLVVAVLLVGKESSQVSLQEQSNVPSDLDESNVCMGLATVTAKDQIDEVVSNWKKAGVFKYDCSKGSPLEL
ncbi:MAG: hypothetical protein KDB27_20785 [Planctomycetales bacterium]|nr:hypothetical protein [Planctomycetales bacterium]